MPDARQYAYRPEIRQKMRQSLGIGEDQLVIGHVGRFYPQKNHKFIIDIFQAVRTKNPEAVLEVAVVVRVFKAGLQRVVVDVGHAQLGLYARDAHRLELEIGHRAGRVLRERLVNAQGDLAAGGHVAAQQMCADDFLSQCLTHGDPSFRSYFSLRGLCVRS